MKRRVVVTALAAAGVTGALAVTLAGSGNKSPLLKPRQAYALASAGSDGTAAPLAKTAIPPEVTNRTFAAPASVGDVRLLTPVPANPITRPELEGPGPIARTGSSGTPPVTPSVPNVMPPPIQNFIGLDKGSWGAGWPPDTVGDVGPNHYIQAVNSSVGIFSKTGAQLAAFTFNTLWSGAGSGTLCDTSHQGDPTVVYDPIGDRFFVGDFTWTSLQNGPYYECIAVSKTSDPVAGGWWLYGIRSDDAAHPWLPDYPKMGIWPDGLYMSANMFDCTTATCSSATYQQVRAYAFNRTQMEAGVAVQSVIYDVGTNTCGMALPNTCFSLQPSHFTGTQPPAGRENFFVGEDARAYDWDVFKFHVVYGAPGSTFTGPTLVSQAAYGANNSLVPSSSNNLDTLTDRVMMQLQYKNLGGTESLWTSHTVLTGGTGTPWGTQWAQIDVTGGTIAATPVQQQIFGAPNFGNDGIHRWMGALAVDKNGSMALGYSASKAAMSPEIRYAGRLAGDALNALPQGEATLVAGTGSQGAGSCSGGTCNRWGDYSAMTLDPDGCTFWYTQEYFAATSSANWQTRVGSFRYPNCGVPTAVRVSGLAAHRAKTGVVVRWRTRSETEALGFHVWRGNTRVSARLIPARHSGQAVGAAYRFVDRAPSRAKGAYRLQLVDLGGGRSWAGVAVIAG